uniref:Trafficking protein particle complex subunit 11 domain-containing protein n=1 Tax=Acrobeloides nanus TaxID=290746 RepID=A0A914BVP2_9BILA
MDPVEIENNLMSGQINQLVILTGLDPTNNPMHNAIFAGFMNKNRDRAPVTFNTLTADHELLRKTEKSVLKSPKGILKTNWPLKYLNERPALLVLFMDLDWNHTSWVEKKTECESKISSLRQSIGDREIRIALVLVQTNRTITVGEDQLATERATELCLQCHLSPKQLFVFPQTDQVLACVIRLEQAFHEIAQQFYQVCLKKIRARPIPNNYVNLLIRQQFKLGFISEMRQDTHSALRHYKEAYKHCSECELPDIDNYELLSVASLLNYKICELAFLHSTALDAISQFRRHQSAFFNRNPGHYPSPQLAAIEVTLWKSQQCSLFAELFERAVTKGLAAYAHQNPGLHLENAAEYYRQANQLIVQMKLNMDPNLRLTTQIDPLAMPDPITGYTIYYGQRPWRIPVENGGLADPVTEHAAKVALELKINVNYTKSLHILNSAMAQYKRYNCERMQIHVMFHMANDYINMKQFSTALQLLKRIVWEFRRENNVQLLYPILLKCLDVSFCMCNIQEYLWTAVQLLNPYLLPVSTHNEAMLLAQPDFEAFLLQNLALIRAAQPPQPLTTTLAMVCQQELDSINAQWFQSLNSRVFFRVDMTRLDSFIEARACFLTLSDEVQSNEHIIVQIAFRNLCATPLIFERCRIRIDDITPAKTTADPGVDIFPLSKEHIVLPASETVTYLFEIKSLLNIKELNERQIVLSTIYLDMGDENSMVHGSFEWENVYAISVRRISHSPIKTIFDPLLGFNAIRIVLNTPVEELEKLEINDDEVQNSIKNL